MFEKLGKRKYILPVAILLVFSLVMTCIFYPMLNMKMKNLPFAIVTLDKGVVTKDGTVNVGDAVVNLMTSSVDTKKGEEPPIKWLQLDSREDLEKAMKKNKYYGAIIIPEDYSQSQYDAIVEAMNTSINSMKTSMSSGMDPSSMKSKLASGLKGKPSSGGMALSPEEQQKMQAAGGHAAGAQKAVAEAALAVGKKQAVVEELKDKLQTAANELQAAKENYEKAAAEGKPEDELLALEKIYQDAEAKVDMLTGSLETESQKLITLNQNLQKASINSGASTKDAMSTSAQIAGTAVASKFAGKLSSIMSAMQTAMSALSGKLSGDGLDKMVQEKAGETMNTIVDTMNEKAEGKAEDETGDDAASIEVMINMGKSPMVANSMQSAMKLMMAQAGMKADINMINEGYTAADDSDGEGMANPASSMMGMQISILPLVLISMIIGVFLSRIMEMRRETSAKQRWRNGGKQALYTIGVSALAGGIVFLMMTYLGKMEVPFGDIFPLLWIGSLCLMLMFTGLGNIDFRLAVLCLVCTIAGGMMLGVLPPTTLPDFWQNWISPWAPQKYMGEGIRSVVYMMDSWWNSGTKALVVYGVIGVVLTALSTIFHKNKDEDIA